MRRCFHFACMTNIEIEFPLIAEVCDPFSETDTMLCSACNVDSGFDMFIWVDTGESLQSFRHRLRMGAPIIIRYIDCPWTFYTCLTIAIISGCLAFGFSNFWLALPLKLSLIYYRGGLLLSNIWSFAANYGDVV